MEKNSYVAEYTLSVNHGWLEEFGSIETSFRATNRPFAGSRGRQRLEVSSIRLR
jgi:hypothetical protein